MLNRALTIVNILLITAGVYLSVNAFYTIATARLEAGSQYPVIRNRVSSLTAELPPPLADYKAIVDRNLFQIDVETTAPKPKTVDIENLKETELKLKLWGTVTGEGKKAYAVVEDTKAREQNLYRVGDTIQNAVVKLILREKVVLTVDGRDEVLAMEETGTERPTLRASTPASRGGLPASRLPVSRYPRKITVRSDQIQEAMENLDELLEQATIRPHVEDGRPAGISITGIKPNAIYRQLRLRNGDVITGVNGQAIESVEDALKIFENLSSSSGVQLNIKRRGREQVLDYNIE